MKALIIESGKEPLEEIEIEDLFQVTVLNTSGAVIGIYTSCANSVKGECAGGVVQFFNVVDYKVEYKEYDDIGRQELLYVTVE